MFGRRVKKLMWRGIGLLLLSMTLAWVGCSTPQERYHVLSFFFDGVPNPDAPKKSDMAAEEVGKPVISAVIISRHKPYVDNNCNACHRSSTGMIMEFEEAYKGCTKCHDKVPTKYDWMHGPVARSACQWCHTAHESSEPSLLKDPPIKVCTQCHDTQLLGPTPVQHTDGITSCLICHGGHGGPERYFLKPNAKPEWPTSHPSGTTNPASSGPASPETRRAEENATSMPVKDEGGVP